MPYDLNRSVNVMNLSAYYFPHFRELKSEPAALEKLDQLTEGYVDDWTKMTIILLALTTFFSVLQSLYKPQFLEVISLFYIIC